MSDGTDIDNENEKITISKHDFHNVAKLLAQLDADLAIIEIELQELKEEYTRLKGMV